MGGAGGLDPVEDGSPIIRGNATAPMHRRKLGGRHGLVGDDPFHLGEGGLPDGLVLGRFDQLKVEVHRPQAILEILLDDFLDARNLGVERQVVVP